MSAVMEIDSKPFRINLKNSKNLKRLRGKHAIWIWIWVKTNLIKISTQYELKYRRVVVFSKYRLVHE